MNISVRTKEGQFAELTVVSDSTTICETVTTLKDGKWIVPENEIDQLLSSANELSRYNNIEDLDFVLNVFNQFLSEGEKRSFIEYVSQSNS